MSVSIDAVIHLTTLKGGSYLTGCCIVITVIFARLVYGEKLTRLSLAGLILVVSGTIMMLF